MRGVFLRAIAVCIAWLAYPTSVDAAPLSTKVTERVVDSAIDNGLEALTKPENQRRLRALLSSTAMTGGVHDIALAVVEGVVDGLGKHAGDIAVDGPRFWSGFDTAARKHVAPAAGAVTREVVKAALDVALSEQNGERIEALAAHASRGFVRGLADGIREDLGPAIAHTVSHDLAPAGADALAHHVMPAIAEGLTAPPMDHAIANTMSSVARNLVRGGDAGIETAKVENQLQGKPGPASVFGDRLSLGVNIALGVAGALVAVLILLAVLLARSNRNQHRLAVESKRRETEWHALVELLHDDDGSIDREKLRELLSQHTSGD